MKGLFWYRHDLRLIDNAALSKAAQLCDDLILVYFYEPNHPHAPGGAQKWWLHHSLSALTNSLQQHGCTLTLLRADAAEHLPKLCKQHDVQSIYWHRIYTPYDDQRDQSIKADLQAQGVKVEIFQGYLLIEPEVIKNKSGEPYKVYTPYSKQVMAEVICTPVLEVPKIKQATVLPGDELDTWQLTPTRPNWATGFDLWQPGESGAQQQLSNFIEQSLADYSQHRDFPSLQKTSSLSAHLHFGEISVNQIWQQVQAAVGANPGVDSSAYGFLRQLIWRDFSYYLLHYFPELHCKNYKSEFDRFEWEENPAGLRAWQQGLTGFPIVDAGMRELWHTGSMHNRVRMIVASFLIKDMLIDWRAGERWFWDTLVDADLANNSASWQWVAGSGADAAPYFRIFNPTTQAQKFDPKAEYIRTWIPELAQLPDKYIHAPDQAPLEILEQADIVLGKTYPFPIVDHKHARQEALSRYKATK